MPLDRAGGLSFKGGVRSPERAMAREGVCGPVAQLVEHETFNLGASGSNPDGLTNFPKDLRPLPVGAAGGLPPLFPPEVPQADAADAPLSRKPPVPEPECRPLRLPVSTIAGRVG